MVDRVRERLESGDEQPTLRDGLAAARLIVEVEGTGAPVEEWTEFCATSYEVAQDLMTPEVWQTFLTRMSRSAVVRRSDARRVPS